MIELMNLDKILPPGILEQLDGGAIDQILEDIAEGARNHWIGLAGSSLMTSRRDYIQSIQRVEMKPGQATISLVGVLANLIEQGMEEVDMHDTLLGPNVPVVPHGERGKHAKADGSGFYRAIPFRHATPGSGGAVGAPMGSQYGKSLGEAAAHQLGKDVYKQAKRLTGTKSDPYKGVSYGQRLPAGLAPKLKPHHKVDIFAGMIRNQKTYEKATQSSYMTFRTISTGSDGWIRPATQGRFYAQKVADYVAQVAPAAFQAYVEGLK